MMKETYEIVENKKDLILMRLLREKANRSQIFSLSFGQQRLWILDRFAPGNPTYNIPYQVSIQGPLHLEILQRSIQSIVNRHEILRTTFLQTENTPIQIIAPYLEVPLHTFDMRTYSLNQQEQEIQLCGMQEASVAFDLQGGPLLKCTVLIANDRNHILFITFHHIIADGLSINVFFQELSHFYNAFLHNSSVEMRPLAIQYADYAMWQRMRFQGSAKQNLEVFWLQQLDGVPTVLAVPTDHPRPDTLTPPGAQYTFEISRTTTRLLYELSMRRQVTLFMTLLAAFEILLYRYSTQPDFLVGIPIAGRTIAEMDSLIGFFVNTLAIRAQISPEMSFNEVLTQVRQRVLDAFAHQEMPFERVVEQLPVQREQGLPPLVQVCFSLRSFSPTHLALENCQVEIQLGSTPTSKFDLFLDVEESTSSLRASIEYNAGLFDATTIERMAGHWHTLLENIVLTPERAIAEQPILTEQEKYQIAVAWNKTQHEYPQRQCIHQLFEEQVERTPERVAILFEESTWTYDKLNREANQLAHFLQAQGVGPDIFVGVCMNRSAEMVVALLAVLKAGGAYVPLDPAYPPERLKYILQDAQVSLLLTQADLQGTLSIEPEKVICVDPGWNKLESLSENNPTSAVQPEHLAYMIYTSGSTGKPKGVQVLHRGVVNFLCSMREQPGITSDDILLSVTTLSFDIAALEIYLPLMVGARLIVYNGLVADAPALMHALDRGGTTVMQATPSTWRLLLDAGWENHRALKMLCGGEALPYNLAQALLKGHAALWNMYGPTETTIWSAIHRLELIGQRTISIGRPIANTQIYILDHSLQLVPIGIPGELYIGGAGLARGYYNRPELTQEKFIQNPFSNDPASRLYRTGDLACYCIDGTIEYLGRADYQVKVRGFRIELGEIEAVLSQHAVVQQCVVAVREDTQGDKQLIAYVQVKKGVTLPTSDVRTHLRQHLPEYMVPAFFMSVESFVLTPNGKVDRQRLPQVDRVIVRNEVAAPRDVIERQLVQIWEEVLGIHPIGISDNFFDLGGESLKALHLTSQIKQHMGEDVDVSSLLREGTIEHLADRFRRNLETERPSTLIKIQAKGAGYPFFAIHPDSGTATIFFDLAQRIGKHQPFYAFQAPGLYGECEPLFSFEEMASFYIEEMMRCQPKGPYFIGGYSLGGSIAFEMAKQLEARGEEVALLALLDTINFLDSEKAELLDDLDYWASWFSMKGFDLIFPSLLEELKERDSDGQLDYIFERFKDHAEIPPRYKLLNSRHILKVQKVTSQASARYRPTPYNGRIRLFQAMERRPIDLVHDAFQGWDGLARSGIEIIRVPGNHHTMLFNPNIQVLAEKLSDCISEIQRTL